MVYKSKLLRYLLTLFYFPSYLIGRFEQKQTLKLILKDNFVDNPVSSFKCGKLSNTSINNIYFIVFASYEIYHKYSRKNSIL